MSSSLTFGVPGVHLQNIRHYRDQTHRSVNGTHTMIDSNNAKQSNQCTSQTLPIVNLTAAFPSVSTSPKHKPAVRDSAFCTEFGEPSLQPSPAKPSNPDLSINLNSNPKHLHILSHPLLMHPGIPSTRHPQPSPTLTNPHQIPMNLPLPHSQEENPPPKPPLPPKQITNTSQ